MASLQFFFKQPSKCQHALILGLLYLDIIKLFSQLDPVTVKLAKTEYLVYANSNIQELFFTLYKGALAIIVLVISFYVAYIRSQAIKQTEKTFEFTQKQFNNTQIQKLNEEIEKRFQRSGSLRLNNLFEYISDKFSRNFKLIFSRSLFRSIDCQYPISLIRCLII